MCIRDRFGEVYYLGTMPGRNPDMQVDVLVATHDVIEARFYFDPESNLMLSMEMYSTGNNDPCELVFDNWKKFDDQFLPQTIEVIHGDKAYGMIQFKDIALGPKKEK